jgi:hypothetical protein
MTLTIAGVGNESNIGRWPHIGERRFFGDYPFHPGASKRTFEFVITPFANASFWLHKGSA